MSRRLTIDISPAQHEALKALAARAGKSVRQFALERLFSQDEARREVALGALLERPEAALDEAERAALRGLEALLAERVAEADAGRFSDRTLEEIWEETLREEGLVKG